MQKVNDLFRKRVINQQSGDPEATVCDIVLSEDARRIVALIAHRNDRSKSDMTIPWDTIVSVGEYVIVDGSRPWLSEDENPEIAELRKEAEQITGKSVMSTTGEQLGTVSDMLYEMSGALVGLELKQGMFGNSGDNLILPAEHIQAIGKDAIIANSTDLIPQKDLEWVSEEPRTDAPHPPLQEPPADVPPASREREVGEPRRGEV